LPREFAKVFAFLHHRLKDVLLFIFGPISFRSSQVIEHVGRFSVRGEVIFPIMVWFPFVNDENGRQISVTASLLVTRLPSTEDVQFNGHISIGGGGESFALSATSDETSLIGPSGSIAFTVEEEIFFNAQDVEEEEENFQDSRETLDKDDWIDNCAERVAENLQSSGVDPSIIEEWRETAKSCHDNDMGEEIFLYRASDLLFTHCQAIALNILLSLVAMHPATYIVILWIRSSPPYVVAYFVSQVCASLYDFRIGIRLTPFLKWARLLIAYRMWRASGRDSLLLPIHVEGKGKLGWDTKSWSSYHQVLRLIKRISSQGQTPVLFMTCITRLCRNPLCFAEMIEEIRSSGGEVLTLRQWNTDFTRLPRIIFAWIKWMTVQAAVRAGGSNNVNPLPQNRSDEITAIGRAGSELILREGSPENKFVKKATLAGVAAMKKHSSLFDRVNAILSRDRMATLQGGVDSLEEIKREVDAVLRDLEGTRPRCKSDGSPSTIVQFTRTSPGSNAAVLQVTDEQFVAVHQCAINVHAAMEKVGKERFNEFDNIIIPESRQAIRRNPGVHFDDNTDPFRGSVHGCNVSHNTCIGTPGLCATPHESMQGNEYGACPLSIHSQRGHYRRGSSRRRTKASRRRARSLRCLH